MELAESLGCSYVEMPADFIKNKSEIKKTGLNLGDIPSKTSIQQLYTPPANTLPQNLKYILHTEPSLPRSDGYGISFQSPLKWYDQLWVASLSDMVMAISHALGAPASVIEIHPGDRRNTFKHILDSVRYIQRAYENEFGVNPMILLENRTGQFITTGTDIASFWNCLLESHPELADTVGIVLDIQQLYTSTKKEFLN